MQIKLVNVILFVGASLDSVSTLGEFDFSCDTADDMVVDWHMVREDLVAVLEEFENNGNVMLKYWQHVRPQTHSLDNIATLTPTAEMYKSCKVGYFAVKAFMVAFSPQREEFLEKLFKEDWEWFMELSADALMHLLTSPWGYVLFFGWHMLSRPEKTCDPTCPQSVAQEMLENGMLGEALNALHSLDYPGGQGLLQVLTSVVPLAQTLFQLATSQRASYKDVIDGNAEARSRCRFHMCSLHEEATPNDWPCFCERVFPKPKQSMRMCIFMIDSRVVEPMRNITEILAARYWSLAFEANRLYAEHRGYSIDYVVPNESMHYPSRKVGWAKVAVILEHMQTRLPGNANGCDFAISIDTDAYFRGTEPLESVVEFYMEGKDILFSQEYHTEERPGHIHINGGFFIVRNTANGRSLLRGWYDVPESKTHEMYKDKNPQGLNFCWDSVMHPIHSGVTVLAPYELFSCPRGRYIRHNWFKDLNFEAELQEVVLRRRAETSPGCILCAEHHVVDLVRKESGKGWINNR